MSDDLI